MVHTLFSKPAAGLEEFVRFYVHREFHLTDSVVVHPVPARPTPILHFDFGDMSDVILLDEGVMVKSPLTVLVGPQTYRRVEMRLQGRQSSFVIMFQPDGLRRLFSVPMHELTDTAGDAHSVLGTRVSELWQALGNLDLFQRRVQFTNEFLLGQASRSLTANGISKAVSYLVQAGGCTPIGTLADGAGLSDRHFARRFTEQTGVGPKLFARIVRFQAALESKALGRKAWTNIAHDFGYYYQMHMVHDFEQLAGGSPKEMLGHLETVFVEPIRQVRRNTITAAAVSGARLTL